MLLYAELGSDPTRLGLWSRQTAVRAGQAHRVPTLQGGSYANCARRSRWCAAGWSARTQPSSPSPSRAAVRRPRTPDRGVAAVCIDELVVGAVLDDAAVVDDGDAVGAGGLREAVGDDQGGSSFGRRLGGALEDAGAGAAGLGGRLVEDDDRAGGHDEPRVAGRL